MPTCPITTDVSLAAKTLRDGGLVAFGTETVYGLGANALDSTAIAKVFEAKNRPFFDPLIVHIADEAWLPKLVAEVSPLARKLMDQFWPGPLTLVLPKTDLVPDLATSGLPSVAIRMPSHSQARKLLETVDLPIVAPSANPFGLLSPTTADHVASTLGDRIDLILDGGPCEVGVESTVVLMTESTPQILRHGGVTQEQIEAVVGPVSVAKKVESETPDAVPAPGMLPQHYAPRTPLALESDVDLKQLEAEGRRLAALCLDHEPEAGEFAVTEVLASDRSLTTAAAQFFAALRKLDSQGLDLIVAWPFPEEGLGRALNDRLNRACHGG